MPPPDGAGRESESGSGSGNENGSGRGSERAALRSLILPGLGHWRAGKRARGGWILAAVVAVVATLAWWGRLTLQPAWLLLALPFWIAQALDAGMLARGEIPRTARMVLLGMLPVYLVGWRATEISPGLVVERYARVEPFFRGLTSPDFVDPVVTVTEQRIQVWTPCKPDEPSRLAELREDAPSMRIEPACAALGETLRVEAAGFPPEVPLEVVWRGPTGDEATLVRREGNAEGTLSTTVVIPEDSIPARMRERNPDLPQDQAIKVVATEPTGGWRMSETLREILENIGVTIALGFVATLAGGLLAIPLSLLGARNLMGANRLSRLAYALVRALMNATRSVESLILAVVFVVWVGQGPFAGALALTVHTVAAIGKLFSEAIESIDEGPIEAIRATGANWLQNVRYAVLPQVLPPFTAFTVYRWDINVRMSTILGFVGGGGIGQILQQWIAKSEWEEVSTTVIVLALLLIVLDQISSTTRERITLGKAIVSGWRRPLLALAIALFTVWAWRQTEVDPGRLARDAGKVLPIGRQLLSPELLESEVISTSLRAQVRVPCGAAAAPAEAPDLQNVGLSMTLGQGCAAEGETIEVVVDGIEPDASARLRWILNEGRRLGAGFMKVDGMVARAEVDMRPLVAEQALESGQPAILELEVNTPTGRETASEPLRRALGAMFETVLMALMASTFGAMLALPLAFLGARNLVPRTPAGNAVYYASRTFMNVSRAIEPLVLAAVFAAWVGVGSPFAGVLALIVVTMANLGKLFSEAVEDIDEGPLEAIRATGANRIQTVWYGVVPQIVPPFLAFGIYHWDINVRISTVVGFVGGGGIGFILYEWMKELDWSAASVAILLIIVVVTVMDTISARVRAYLV